MSSSETVSKERKSSNRFKDNTMKNIYTYIISMILSSLVVTSMLTYPKSSTEYLSIPLYFFVCLQAGNVSRATNRSTCVQVLS